MRWPKRKSTLSHLREMPTDEPPKTWWIPGKQFLYGWIFVGILWLPFAYLILGAGIPEGMWGIVCLALPLTVVLGLWTLGNLRVQRRAVRRM